MRRESEAKRREREEAWEVFQGKKIAEIHATERHLFGLNEETHAVAANLEKLREERRQEEARIERLKLEREEREWREKRAEEDRRAYDDQLLRLEEMRREIAHQIAREREQTSPDFTRPYSASRQARIASVWEDERPPTTFRRSGTSSQTYTVPSSAALVSNLELEEHSADRHVAQPTAGSHSAANLEGIQSQPNSTTSIFSNLSSSVHPSTSATSAPIYVPPWRRQNGPQPQTGSGHSRTSVSAAQAATRGISFPCPNAFLSTATEETTGLQDQGSGPPRQTLRRRCEEWETQVHGLAADEEEVGRLQERIAARRANLIAELGIQTSTSQVQPTVPQTKHVAPNLGPYLPLTSSLQTSILQPWLPSGLTPGMSGLPHLWPNPGVGVQVGLQNTTTPILPTLSTWTPQTPTRQPSIENPNNSGKQTGAAEPNRSPPDPDPDPDGDPEKRKRDKTIDAKRKGQFPIDSDYLKATKGRARGNMKCEVERYERGTDLNIKDWISQMETYFTVGQIPPEAFVGFMLMKIVPKHLDEIKEYKNLDYLAFREKLLEVFEEPDLTTAHLNALSSNAQDRDETISEYMRRTRLLVLKAHPNLEHSARERILVTSFLLGLHDKQLAASLAVARIQTAAEAERLAAEGEAVRRDQKSRRASGNYLLTSTRTEQETSATGNDPAPLEEEEEGDEDEEDLTAAPLRLEAETCGSRESTCRKTRGDKYDSMF